MHKVSQHKVTQHKVTQHKRHTATNHQSTKSTTSNKTKKRNEKQKLGGTGLGFRRSLVGQLRTHDLSVLDFFELSPENWLTKDGQMGGAYDSILREFTERFPFVCHGLSLSIGSSRQLDSNLLKNIKAFMTTHDIKLYTEHLSWCSDDAGHLYDLLPIPCTQEAVKLVSTRIKQAQDIMGQQIGFENASYYFRPTMSDMSDGEFITAICEEANCLLHLDVNNIYVNSHNFGFDAHQYLRELPLERTCYLHVAGHYVEPDGFLIDTHGNKVIDPVWSLLDDAYGLIEATGKKAKDIPTCLERDFNFPPLAELLDEASMIKAYQTKTYSRQAV